MGGSIGYIANDSGGEELMMKKWLVPLSTLVLLVFVQVAAFGAPSVTLKQAVESYNSGKYAQALSEFSQHAAATPNSPIVHYYLALCHQALNHRSQAKAEYEWVAQRGDPTLRAHAAKGLQVLAQSGRSHSSGPPIYGGTVPSAKPSNPGSAPPTGAATAQGKVKKIIEFWASW